MKPGPKVKTGSRETQYAGKSSSGLVNILNLYNYFSHLFYQQIFFRFCLSHLNNCTKMNNYFKTTKFKESLQYYIVMEVNNPPVTGQNYQNIF